FYIRFGSLRGQFTNSYSGCPLTSERLSGKWSVLILLLKFRGAARHKVAFRQPGSVLLFIGYASPTPTCDTFFISCSSCCLLSPSPETRPQVLRPDDAFDPVEEAVLRLRGVEAFVGTGTDPRHCTVYGP